MNKDLDSRLIPNGEYRHGENISVSASEGSDVGALENIRGNASVAIFGIDDNDLEIIGPAGGSVTAAISDAGISLTATASGGAGGNSFAWTNFELADDAGVFSVSATGTTNQATYSGLVIAMDTSGSFGGGEEFSGSYRIRCTVTDSASATATADYTVNIIGVVE